VINSFSPAYAGAGTTVTINGTNLSGATSVKFGGVEASITGNTDNQITVTVAGGPAVK
jgi:hypothetical protein